MAGGTGRWRSGERHTFHEAWHVDLGDEPDLTEVAFTFTVFALSEVPATLLAAQDFAGSRDLEPFHDAFPRLASSNFLSHKRGRKWQRTEERQLVIWDLFTMGRGGSGRDELVGGGGEGVEFWFRAAPAEREDGGVEDDFASVGGGVVGGADWDDDGLAEVAEVP